MLKIEIPGSKALQLEHLVMDYNGTLAVDGKLIDGVKERLVKLSEILKIHVITADTFGRVEQEMKNLPCTVKILQSANQTEAKQDYIAELGRKSVVAIGNGCNDRLMIENAALGIVVVQQEGAAIQTLISADIVCNHICDALDLLLKPLRIKATLRT